MLQNTQVGAVAVAICYAVPILHTQVRPSQSGSAIIARTARTIARPSQAVASWVMVASSSMLTMACKSKQTMRAVPNYKCGPWVREQLLAAKEAKHKWDVT